jgi:Tol biopolymer transport system component
MCLAMVGAAVVMPTAAEAAFPGTNGFIVFSSSGFLSGRSCAGRHQQDQLFELPAQGSSPFQLTCTPGRDEHPFVSPDGTEVVFSNTHNDEVSQLFTLSLSTTRHRRFAHSTLVSDAPQASDHYASWSPAGDGTIVFQRSTSGSPSQLYIENVADPSSAAPVFPSPTGFSDTEPVFDPSDPNVIAFVRPVGGQSHIFTYDVTTQVLSDLSAQGDGGNPGNDSKPDFAPVGAGGRIVFESDRACGYSQLYTMTSQGTDQTSVLPSTSHTTPTGTVSCATGGNDPVYSPQGDQLAFDREGFFPPGHGDGYERGGHAGSTWLSFVAIDASGTAVGDVTGFKGYGATGVQPSWGPSATPPAQTPEASLPIVLPVLGAGVVGTAVLFRRRRGAIRRA